MSSPLTMDLLAPIPYRKEHRVTDRGVLQPCNSKAFWELSYINWKSCATNLVASRSKIKQALLFTHMDPMYLTPSPRLPASQAGQAPLSLCVSNCVGALLHQVLSGLTWDPTLRPPGIHRGRFWQNAPSGVEVCRKGEHKMFSLWVVKYTGAFRWLSILVSIW